MRSKSFYRSYFAQCKPFIKFNYFLSLVPISSGSFSYFMKGEAYDYLISLDKLDSLYSLLQDRIKNLA